MDACVPVQTQLLGNPAFDTSPDASWTQQPIDETNFGPIISPGQSGGVVPQTPSFMAWLGGVYGDEEGTSQKLVDEIYEDVAIPANTTSLVLTGYYNVKTGETGSSVFDRGSLSLNTTSNTVIENVLSLTNANATADWTPINHTVNANVAGQTVRLFMTSSNDFSNATSFYFDSFSLVATHCP
jgi:hypothetical protein